MNITSKNYWQKRRELLWKNLEKDEVKLNQKLYKYYKEQANKLGREIAVYYARYGKDNVIEYQDLLKRLSEEDRSLLLKRYDEFIKQNPRYKHLLPIRKSIYELDRLQALNYSIQLQQAEIGIKEEEEISEHLKRVYGDSYTQIVKDLGFGDSFIKIDDVAVNLLINKKWIDDSSFSDSVWNNKNKLTSYLTNDFRDGIIRGDSYNKLVNQMAKRFEDRSKSDIKRLIFTEGTRINNEAMITPFEDHKINEEYEYVSVIDEKTSDICRSLDGEIFKLKDRQVGVNFPPMHPHCRSSFNIVIPDDYIDRYVKAHGGDRITR